MRVTTGIVRRGKVELDDNDLPDGTPVAVIVRDSQETFELSPEEEAKLLEAIAELDRGEYEDGRELLRELRQKK